MIPVLIFAGPGETERGSVDTVIELVQLASQLSRLEAARSPYIVLVIFSPKSMR
jgi:hypothetical protein